MNHLVGDVLGGVVLGGGPQVALLVPIGLDEPVHGGHEHVAPDVEFPFVEEHGLVDVELDDVGLRTSVLMEVVALDYLQYFSFVGGELDASPSVRDLARLHDPDALRVRVVELQEALR